MMLRNTIFIDESLRGVEGRFEVVISDIEALHPSLYFHFDRKYMVVLDTVDAASVTISCKMVH